MYRIDEQFMFGTSFLVAPKLGQNKPVNVIFP